MNARFGAAEKKGEHHGLCERLQPCRKTQGRVKDYRLLKRNGKNLFKWEVTHASPEKTHPQRRFERFPEFYQASYEALPLYEAHS